MNTYQFAFQLQGLDEWGQEHRLRTTIATGLKTAVRELVNYVGKILKVKPDYIAARTILLKSAWKTEGKKTQRITIKEFTEAMLAEGFVSTHGREEQRVEKFPRKTGTPLYRKHRRK